jgi:hypothetical protein
MRDTLLAFWESDRLRKFFVGLGIAIIIICLPLIVLLEYRSYEQSQNYHNATSGLLNDLSDQIDATKAALSNHTESLAQLKQLQETTNMLAYAMASVILKLPAADAYLGQLATGLESQVTSLCVAVRASCDPLPVKLPSTTPTAVGSTTTLPAPQTHVSTPLAPSTAPSTVPPPTSTSGGPNKTTTTTTTTKATTTTTRPVTTTTRHHGHG